MSERATSSGSKSANSDHETGVYREVALSNGPGRQPCAMVFLSADDLLELGASTADGSLRFAVVGGQFRVA